MPHRHSELVPDIGPPKDAAHCEPAHHSGGGCSCGCGSGRVPCKQADIAFLYTEPDVCGCRAETEAALDDAVKDVTPVLAAAGYTVTVGKTPVDTREQAAAHCFAASPTIRVNGRDIAAVKTTPGAACRVFEYRGETYSAPPKGLIAAAILRLFALPYQAPQPCALPEEPERIEAAKTQK